MVPCPGAPDLGPYAHLATFIKSAPEDQVSMLYKCHRNLLQCLHFIGLKYHGKLPRYESLPPWDNVIKLFAIVIYSHYMDITNVILLYKTERQHSHGIAINYHAKKF